MTRHQELHLMRKFMKILKRELLLNKEMREKAIWGYPPASRLPL